MARKGVTYCSLKFCSFAPSPHDNTSKFLDIDNTLKISEQMRPKYAVSKESKHQNPPKACHTDSDMV